MAPSQVGSLGPTSCPLAVVFNVVCRRLVWSNSCPMLLLTPKSLPLRLAHSGRVRVLHRPRRLLLQRLHIPAAAAQPNRSFDDELERSPLDDEFQKSFDPARYQRLAEHLNLLWEVSKVGAAG